MHSSIGSLGICLLVTGAAMAQTTAARHNLEIGGGGVFPVGGYHADEYSAGPAGRLGYELRLFKPLGVEVGITEAGLPGTECTRFGCTHPRQTMRFFDTGLRGHVITARGRLDLSVGIGGGYIWHEYGYSFYNSPLLQYSGKAAVGIDHANRWQLAVTVRTWRDLGSPIQQWLSTTGSLIFAFGRM